MIWLANETKNYLCQHTKNSGTVAMT